MTSPKTSPPTSAPSPRTFACPCCGVKFTEILSFPSLGGANGADAPGSLWNATTAATFSGPLTDEIVTRIRREQAAALAGTAARKPARGATPRKPMKRKRLAFKVAAGCKDAINKLNAYKWHPKRKRLPEKCWVCGARGCARAAAGLH